MENAHESSSPTPAPAGGGFLPRPIALLLGAVLLAIAVYFVFFHSPAPAPVSPVSRLPYGPEEQAYAAKLQFGDFAMSRAENFLHQEVTMLSGEVLNSGERSLRGIEVTIAFQDDMQQVVLREVRPLFPSNAAPLEAGKSAKFEISFDHIPASWNMQLPAVRVSGLEFARTK